ncbi:LuxR C-terminal-related transcriptional regulator [Gordonia sp. ABSL49_1]|uniref:ATP-binding protein n=1 Tax=Gordonia sp. ABSL49_1 TaxID=2920941 RepID=UPI001F0F6F5A|nr:LuxR C-terminal-related transcriptional regulator [Gordonia sp. ABSL49_1]MCH5645006.1 LuxR C-terminal-related transcriptional regulator [Gordonia sp. ABSL49_1]
MNADEWAQIHRCHDDGESIKGIAARLGMSRNTVRRALSLAAAPDDHRRCKGSVSDDADRRIREILLENPGISIAEISRALQWERSRTLLSRKVNAVRAELPSPSARSDTVPTGLPQPTTSFVGRRNELRELRRLFGDHRLVSVVGPGGIGKTRLSVQAATEFRRAFPDGVRFVEFAAVRNEGLLAQALCDCLALENRDTHDRSAEDAALAHLRNRRMLLVFDNCEHVIDGAADLVSRLMVEAAGVRVLVTSRENLAIPGEYVFHLAPLKTDDGVGSDAMELFSRRAEAVLSGFVLDDGNVDAVRRICERLDGLPLAIELACTRLTVLSVDDLGDLLDRRLSVLSVGSRDRTPRHRSLQATIEWSYELCSSTEKLLWNRVASFADGFDLDMVVDVCSDDALPASVVLDSLAALVAKSVLLRDGDGRHVRFRMLESIREFGWGKLTAAERLAMSTRLLDWCARLIIDCAEHWYGPDQLAKAARVQENRGNIRAALHSALDDPDDGRGRAAAEALGAGRFLWACGISVREHRLWLTQALELPDVPSIIKGRILGVLGLVQTLQGDRDAAGFTLHRAGVIAEREHDVMNRAFVTHTSGLRDYFAGDFDSARVNLDAAARGYTDNSGPSELLATLAIHRGMLLSSLPDTDAAAEVFGAVFAQTETVDEWWFHSYATYGLGLVALLTGDVDRAVDLADDALRAHRAFADPVGTTLMCDLLGWALAEQRGGLRAVVVLGAASSMWGSFGQQLYGSEHWNSLRSKAVDTLHAQVPDAEFDNAWARGAAMSTAELYDYVFGTPAAHDAHEAADDPSASLSPREREVADLVASGLSNREIAEKLVLSTRTVEGHVEHVLHKLCLRRRAEVAEALVDHAAG